MNSSASFETERASSYMMTLCKHFGRKVEARYDASEGSVVFPFGRCDLAADQGSLKLLATADDKENLDAVVRIVTSHLERFAFRENPQIVWQAESA